MHYRFLTFVMTLFALWWPLSGIITAEEEDPVQDIQEIRQELERIKKEMQEQKNRSEEEIRKLKEEINDLKTRLRAGEGSGAEKDELDALLGDLEGGEEDELDALLGDLTGVAEEGPIGEEPTFTQSLGQAFQSMNPDISIIGDFIGHYTSTEGSDLDDEFRFRELELSFSSAIDPYARADFYVGLGQEPDGEWEIGLEEGYATFLAVPWDLQPRVGRFKGTFGKANPTHLHALPWVEYPLVIENYFGEEGLSGDGLGVSWLVPNPWDKFIELTYEITNNDNDLFAGTESDDFLHVLHLKNFFDISDASTLEVGLSFATAPNDERHGSDRTSVEGIDLTYKWRPPQSGLYKSFLWQTEIMGAQVDLPGGREDSKGLYTALDYQFDRRWTVGTRYDYSEMPHDLSLHENAYTGFLTFIQSEFLFWRLAYRYTDRNFLEYGDSFEHEVFLQLNFGIGRHRAHKY